LAQLATVLFRILTLTMFVVKSYLLVFVWFGLTLRRLLLPHGYNYIKHLVPERVKPSFVIFDIRALWRSGLSVRVPGCQKLQMTA